MSGARAPAPRARPLHARFGMAAVPIVAPLVDLGVRGALLWLLFQGLLAASGWAGHLVLNPGDWLETDIALYRAINGISSPMLTAFWVAALNEPIPDFFAVIVVILAYCLWRKRALLPAAVLAMGIALFLGQVALTETVREGARPRAFLSVAEARTPIQSCGGLALVAMRGAEGPGASCDGSTGEIIGQDWREIWVQHNTFPSGHVREIAALTTVLAAIWPASWPYGLAYTVVMGFSRVHLGAHYPTDVLFGALVGVWGAAIALLGLDTLRRLLSYLHRLPLLGAAWDWIAVSRLTGRPDLDPLPARLIRIAAYAAGANLTLSALGYAATDPGASQLHSILQGVDGFARAELAARFEPAAAPTLYYATGPAGALYALLGGATLISAWLRRRSIAPIVVTLALAVAVAIELRWTGDRLFPREQPFLTDEQPALLAWRAAWGIAGSFPSLHSLLAAALAGVLAGVWRPLALPAHLVAIAGALTAVYFGAAWGTDALAGFLMGSVAATLAHYAAAQFFAPDRRGVAGRAQAMAQRLARHPGSEGAAATFSPRQKPRVTGGKRR